MGSERITANKGLGRRAEREVEGRYNATICRYCLMAGEQRVEWRGRYNVTLCTYCLMAGEQEMSRW